MLESLAFKQYSDQGHWHNQFRKQIVMRIDESVFSILFNNTTGAPNAPVRTLIGMMIFNESFEWSDSQLFEPCRFNLLARSAIGLFNISDTLPVESTYYLLRKRIYDHQKQGGEDLMENAFAHITRGQIKEFDVNDRNIRMDSKLIGSILLYLPVMRSSIRHCVCSIKHLIKLQNPYFRQQTLNNWKNLSQKNLSKLFIALPEKSLKGDCNLSV